MNARSLVARGVALAAFVVAVGAAAQGHPMGYREDPKGKDELWEVQSTMEMEGMRMAMPGGPQRVCIEKGKQESGAPTRGECKVLEQRQSGNRYIYKMACKEGRNDYTITGDTVWNPQTYEGNMRMQGTMDGRPSDMKMSYNGRRVGNCVSTVRDDMAKMQADAKAQGDQYCRDQLDRFTWQVFEGQGPCVAKRNEFQAAVARAATDMRDPVQHVAYSKKSPDMRTAFAKYNQDYDATTRAACGAAVQSRNWSFVGSGNCDDDVRAQGRGVCDQRGRSPEQQFFPLCSRYVAITRGQAGSASSSTSAAPSAAPRAPAPVDPVQQGVDAVRKLLPF